MKIGILTFHNTINYGATLQAYALRHVLLEMGHDAQIVDYRCPAVTQRETPRHYGIAMKVRHPRYCLRKEMHYPAQVTRAKAFAEFNREELELSARKHDSTGICEGFDAVVVGSDQVWNLVNTKGDETYFMGGVRETDTRLVSYAASFGAGKFSADQALRCGEALRRFHALSVREQSGLEIVERLTGRKAEVVLDPTLLLSSEEWGRKAGTRLIEEEYVFCYMVSEVKDALEFAKAKAREMGAKLICIDCYGKRMPSRGIEWRNDATPTEFLSLMRHASLVIASSFHGFSLSIAMGVQVYYTLNSNVVNSNSRLTDLEAQLGLTHRNIVECESRTLIDYETVNSILEAERACSLSYLDEALSVKWTYALQ